MKNIIYNTIDWVSIKLNAICLIGFVSGDNLVTGLTVIATLSTITYNFLKIHKTLKNKNK
jgi:hypothetical protein